MSQQYDNTNRGVLFPNDRKTKANHPDYKGHVDIDGEERWLSAWVKESKNGEFLSLAVGDVRESQSSGARTLSKSKTVVEDEPTGEPDSANGKPDPSASEFEDDIPF